MDRQAVVKQIQSAVEKRKWGLGKHVHHDKLFEFVWDFQQRVNYIETQKPPEEVELRKRLFKMVVGPLPPPVAEAVAECSQVWAVYNQTWAAYNKAWAASSQAWNAFDKDGAAYDKAGAAYNKALNTLKIVLKANMPAMLALHAQECPDCPWDGETIFP